MRWIIDFVTFIRFNRSIYVIPYALGAYLVCNRGWGSIEVFFEILICLTAAVVMFLFFNRYHENEYSLNSDVSFHRGRQHRERLLNMIGPGGSLFISGSALLVLILGTLAIRGRLLWWLIPLVGIMACYAPARRIHWGAHFLLGAIMGAVVPAVYLAILGKVTMSSILLGSAIMFWTAGYDTIVALQRTGMDETLGRVTAPLSIGHTNSVYLARVCHFVSMLAFLSYGVLERRGLIYVTVMLLIGFIVAFVHWRLPRLEDRAHVSRDFFNMNALVSIGFFGVTVFVHVSRL
ncbi:MAG: UbiA family prenyltransferase [bacterium]